MSETETVVEAEPKTEPDPAPEPTEAGGARRRSWRPPPLGVVWTAARTRRWPRLAAAALLAAAVAVAVVGSGPDRPGPTEQRGTTLTPTEHQVVYEVTSAGGKSPEIRFATDGMNTTRTVQGATLPWRTELTLRAGPGLAIAQVMAANGQAKSISCAVRVDGKVVDRKTARGPYANVACSGVIRPGH